MKQTKLVLLLMCVTSLTVFAQDETTETGIGKGNWLAGGTLSFEDLTSLNNVVFTVNPKVGYFVTNKLALGLDARFHYNGATGSKRAGLGPFARYYFMNSRFAPFVEGEYNYGWSRTRFVGLDGGTVEETTHQFGGGVGLNYFITKNVALESTLKYLHYSGEDSGSLNLNIGFQIFLNRKNR